MPLVSSILENEIKKLSDPFPEDTAEAASRWAAAVNKYAKEVLPASLTGKDGTAELAFEGIFSAIDPDLENAADLFVDAFVAYTVALGVGMAPSHAPPTPVKTSLMLQPAFAIGEAGGSAADVAVAMAGIIDVWFKTGTVINVASGAVIPWT